MKAVVDTGPLLAAADKRDRAHRLASALIKEFGRDLLVPDPVLVEVEQLLRSRVSTASAATFLASMAAGELQVAFLTPGLLNRAVEINAKFLDLSLGLVDASVMAVAERHDLPVLTFDFPDFRAAPPESGYWRLVVAEAAFAQWMD